MSGGSSSSPAALQYTRRTAHRLSAASQRRLGVGGQSSSHEPDPRALGTLVRILGIAFASRWSFVWRSIVLRLLVWRSIALRALGCWQIGIHPRQVAAPAVRTWSRARDSHVTSRVSTATAIAASRATGSVLKNRCAPSAETPAAHRAKVGQRHRLRRVALDGEETPACARSDTNLERNGYGM
jgi:hypothetical protein